MKTYFAAVALIATLAQPAAAITFPSLTTIYVGTGVVDDGSAANTGVATSFNCSNVSGVSAEVRFLVLGPFGAVEGNMTTTVPHGGTTTASTHLTASYSTNVPLATGVVSQGAVNIESTQSGVFCNAIVTDAADAGNGFDINMVRVNPHPGTVE